jgi:outer membrane receptor protein involved in Fe transport
VRHQGIEASIRVGLLDWLEALGSFTYDDTQIRRGPGGSDGGRIPITPIYRGDAALRVALPFGFDGTFRGRWSSNRMLSNDFSDDDVTMAKYGIYDLLLGFRPVLHENLDVTLGFALRNLFNSKYFDFGADFGGTGFFYPAPKRNYEVSLSMTLRR